MSCRKASSAFEAVGRAAGGSTVGAAEIGLAEHAVAGAVRLRQQHHEAQALWRDQQFLAARCRRAVRCAAPRGRRAAAAPVHRSRDHEVLGKVRPAFRNGEGQVIEVGECSWPPPAASSGRGWRRRAVAPGSVTISHRPGSLRTASVSASALTLNVMAPVGAGEDDRCPPSRRPLAAAFSSTGSGLARTAAPVPPCAAPRASQEMADEQGRRGASEPAVCRECDLPHWGSASARRRGTARLARRAAVVLRLSSPAASATAW